MYIYNFSTNYVKRIYAEGLCKQKNLMHVYAGTKISKFYIHILKISSAEAYSGTPQIYRVESFATIVDSLQLLTIVLKLSILDILGGLGYATVVHCIIQISPNLNLEELILLNCRKRFYNSKVRKISITNRNC